jgi:hypothetical protein
MEGLPAFPLMLWWILARAFRAGDGMELKAAAAVLFCSIHSCIGMLEKPIDILIIIGIQCDSYAHRHGHVM